MLFRAAILLTLSTLFQAEIRAQDFLYSVSYIKTEPGKLGNHIRCIARDKAGLIWLGTMRGVMRYNGHQFDRPLDAIPDWRLPSPDIQTIDAGGDTLFIGTLKGLKVLDVSTFKPVNIPGYVDNGGHIMVVRHDPSSGFWWYRDDGILFNFYKGKLRTLALDLDFPVDLRAFGQHVWISGHKKKEKGKAHIGLLYRVDKESMNLREELRTNSMNIFPFIFENARGRPVYSHNKRFISLPEAKEEWGTWQTSDLDFQIREEIGDHRFMVVNYNQLFHEYRIGNDWKRTRVPLDLSVPFSIYKVFPAGDRLLITTTAGLINLQYRRNTFVPIRSTLIRKNGIYEDPRGIAEDEEHIFIAGYHSINAWRKSDAKLRLINAEDLLTHGMILHNRHLWLATEGNGLIRMDPVTGRYVNVVKDTTDKNNFLISNAAWGDTILIGGYTCFNAYLPAQDRFLNPVIRLDSISVSDLMVKKILPLDRNRCLLGTDKGIFMIGRDFSVLKHMRPPNPDQRPGIDIINDIVVGRDGSIWAATFDGIIKFDSSGRIIRHITHQEGLAGDLVASLVSDAGGRLWAGTYDGLSKIETSSGRVENFFKADGLPDDEFNHSSVHVARSGDIFMGTISGFIRYDPRTTSRSSVLAQKIRISRAEFGREDDVKVHLNLPYLNAEALLIGPNVKYLRLHFYADPAQMPEQTVYEYRIDGVHERWMKMGPSPILHIDNARSGQYTLRVRFISGIGSEEIIEARFPLVVEQYFYTKPAFYVAIIGTLMIFIILYVRTIMLRDRKLMEIRQELASDLHDEVGGYLAGLLMKIDFMTKGTQSREYQFITLRNLASKAVFGLKDGLWSLDTKTDTAQQLWDRFKRIAQESLDPLDIPYRFAGTKGMSNVPMTLIEKRNLLFILKECLNNAIKHGDGKGVWFEWKIERAGMHAISVRNGIGLEEEGDLMEGLGLENMQRRISRIRGVLMTDQREGIFTVKININLRHDQIGRD